MNKTPLPRSFFERDTVEVAKELLGKIVVHETAEGTTAGMIIEVEAYLHPHDEAAHTFRGETPRTAAMFGPAGHAYVYFTYGMHYCMNVVTVKPGEGILIRALEPVAGIELMKTRRKQTNMANLCSGPGKLTQAMGIGKAHNSIDLTQPPLYITAGKIIAPEQISVSPRIGISRSRDLPLRFFCI